MSTELIKIIKNNNINEKTEPNLKLSAEYKLIFFSSYRPFHLSENLYIYHKF